jgi:hypothetical protein
MAVEVIGQDDSVSRQTSCVGCGAKLKYYKNDVRSQTTTDYTGGSDTDYTIICAKCGKPVNVKQLSVGKVYTTQADLFGDFHIEPQELFLVMKKDWGSYYIVLNNKGKIGDLRILQSDLRYLQKMN